MDAPVTAPRTARSSRPTRALVALVEGYRRFVSPLFPPSCRFYPSCSAYAVAALREHGAVRGTALTLVRLLKCGPWHPGGVDHVPRRTTPPAGAPTTEEQASC